jgi:hypothetical protein
VIVAIILLVSAWYNHISWSGVIVFNVPYKIRFQTHSDSAVSVKYLISHNYYIQINKTWYYINVYTTIKDYLAVAWWFLPVNYNYSRSRNMIAELTAEIRLPQKLPVIGYVKYSTLHWYLTDLILCRWSLD